MKFIDRNIFLIDGVGALLSAFMLGVVLRRFESFFGIPASALLVLALIPCFFVVYDLFCHRYGTAHRSRLLWIIALLNVVYCLLSLGFAYFHRSSLTIYGWVYILVEIVVVIWVAWYEIQLANKLAGPQLGL